MRFYSFKKSAGLIFIGVFIAIVVELVGIPVLPFAIGVYLPVQLNACIMVGGIVRWFVDKIKNEDKKKNAVNNGILFSSGMIAGEGIVGLLLAIFAVIGISDKIDLSGMISLPAGLSEISGVLMFGVIIISFVFFGILKKDKKTN